MIKVLGAAGSLDQDRSCITLQLNQTTLIDAGNVIRPLGKASRYIEQVFLTHAHFDHITDLPFLIETFFEERQKPLTIFALQDTLETLQNHIFNNHIWPEFQKIEHKLLKVPMLKFQPITIGESFQTQDLTITAISANHSKGSCGYVVKQNGYSCLITGDTYINPQIAQTINNDNSIQSLLIDISFPSDLAELAEQSKHLTPKLLNELLQHVERPITVFPYHLKPVYEDAIISELASIDDKATIHSPLKEGDSLDVFTQKAVQAYPQAESAPTDNTKQLASLLTTAQALSSETDENRLLELILKEAMAFSQADGGTLYRLSEDQQELIFTVVQNQSLDIHMGGTAEPITWDNLPLFNENGQPNEQMVATYCALHKKMVHIESIYNNKKFDFEGTKKFDATTGYHSESMLVLPLLNSSHELLGVLQLINKTDKTGQSIAFSEADKQNTSALASQAAISLTNTLLIKNLEQLFESVIGTITKAFDEKCSFTGGHVRQVAELAKIISHGINQDKTIYREVQYSKDDYHEINIAALLHDVGKIATPEFIMQKATKLEKVYDRIHAIQDRFEILKRDAKIELLESQLPQHALATQQSDYENRVQQLNDDLAFIQKHNSGEQYLQDEDIDRIEAIAKQTYTVNDQACSLLNQDEKLNLSIRAGTLN
ncbi:MAG: MBL fold metallo-hydrolase, partial [Thiomicrorhabdus sp.]|nr:MBL fold metallo-hydrolase [Thiomicrorhabdus sp.]